MKILLSWLNEYGDFADPADADAVARLSDTMSRLGLPIDDVRHVGNVVQGVVTARVERLEQHPDAAKVQRVYVDAGDGTPRHVWCSAFNMQVGDIVPLATLGTKMPDGRTIERRGILETLRTSDGVEEVLNVITLHMGDDVMVAVKARMRETGSVTILADVINRAEARLKRAYPQIKWIFFEPDVVA